MPYTMNGTCKRYSYLTASESAAFWHKQKDTIGAPISASAVRALKAGKKVTVQERQPEGQLRPSSEHSE